MKNKEKSWTEEDIEHRKKNCCKDIVDSDDVFRVKDVKAFDNFSQSHLFNQKKLFFVLIWIYMQLAGLPGSLSLSLCSLSLSLFLFISLSLYLSLSLYISLSLYLPLCEPCKSQIFAAIRFIDAYGTKNPYQSSLSLWGRENWKPVEILGREINSEAVGSLTQANVYGDPSNSVIVISFTLKMYNYVHID
jgi:hypothetical protein